MSGLKVQTVFVVFVTSTFILSTCRAGDLDVPSSSRKLRGGQTAQTSSSRSSLQESASHSSDVVQKPGLAQSERGQTASAGTSATATSASGTTSAGTAVGKQMKRQRQNKPVFESHVVDFAPAVSITDGDDVDFAGQCKIEIDKYCDDLEEGEGKLAECLSDAISLFENPELGDEQEDIPVISDACREEVYQFKISRHSNINKNVPLAAACKLNAGRMCNTTWFFGYRPGQVIACLRENKDKLDKECQSEVFKVQKDVAEDVRADPLLWGACKTDAEALCKDVKAGGGRVLSCLREKRLKLSWRCSDQVFGQGIESARDIRLSVQMNAKCMADRRKFCKGVEPGNADVLECLEEHRLQLGSACRREMDDMLERRAGDYRLDFKLKTACDADIFGMCAYTTVLADMDMYDVSPITCLQDFKLNIKSPECKQQVNKHLALAAQDIRFDVRLAEACYGDRQKFCKDVPPGSGRVIRCLSGQRDQLSAVCRVTLLKDKVRFSESIDFQLPMKEACQAELNNFCKDVPHGNALSIRCLQDNKYDEEFGKACKEEVVAYEQEIIQDYRLNYRLAQSCKEDIKVTCPNMCVNKEADASCGSTVLSCLTDNMDNIKADGCRQEVVYYKDMKAGKKPKTTPKWIKAAGTLYRNSITYLFGAMKDSA